MHGHSRFIATQWLTGVMMTALLLGGCSTWRMEGQAPATVVSSSEKPRDLRVTLPDGRKLEVYRAAVERDSLVGFATDPTSGASAWSAPARPPQVNRVAIALSDIRVIEIRAHNGETTALLVLFILAVVAGGVVLVAASPSP